MTTNSTLLSKVLITLTIFSTTFTNVNALGTSNEPKTVIVTPTDNLSNNIYSFNAVIIDNKSINLNWITKSEENNVHFEVERSFDNSNFKTVALVLDGFSTDTDEKAYKFKENKTALQGQTSAYYRLKQIEANGSVKFSKTLVVNFPSNTDVNIQVTPSL